MPATGNPLGQVSKTDAFFLMQRWRTRVSTVCSTVSVFIRKVKTVKKTLRNSGIFAKLLPSGMKLV